MDSQYWIKKLDLQSHPEGGFYKETYRSEEYFAEDGLPSRFGGNRNYSTAIYFLLEKGNFSAFHRIRSDEVWHFYAGDGITIFMLRDDGELETIHLGANPEKGEVLQTVVPAEVWFASKVSEPGAYGLVGCTVSPGFDFADFEMADRGELIRQFPQHKDIITALTR